MIAAVGLVAILVIGGAVALLGFGSSDDNVAEEPVTAVEDDPSEPDEAGSQPEEASPAEPTPADDEPDEPAAPTPVVDEPAESGQSATETPVEFDGAVVSQTYTLAAGEVQNHPFELAADEAVTIFVVGSEDDFIFDPVIEVLDPEGFTVAQNDDYLDLNSAVSFTAEGGGTYTLVVSEFSSDPGGYEVTFEPGFDPAVANLDGPLSTIEELTFELDWQGSTLTEAGTIGDATSANYQIEFDAGEPITIFVNGDDFFDPVLEVRDPSGSTIAQNDDFVDLNSAVAFTTGEAGAYTLVISDFDAAGGSFEIVIEPELDPDVAAGP